MRFVAPVAQLMVLVFAIVAGVKLYQGRDDLRPKFKIGQKVLIKHLEQWVDDGKDTHDNAMTRNERKYLSGGKAFVAGYEWWPGKVNEMTYWIGSTDPDYGGFVGVKESGLIDK